MRPEWQAISGRYTDEELIEAAFQITPFNPGLRTVKEELAFLAQALAQRLQKANQELRKMHGDDMGEYMRSPLK